MAHGGPTSEADLEAGMVGWLAIAAHAAQPSVGLTTTAGFEGAVLNGAPVGGRFDADLFASGWDLGGGMAFGVGWSPGRTVLTQAEDVHLGRRVAVGADAALTVWAGATRFQAIDDLGHLTAVGPMAGAHVDLCHLRKWEEWFDGEVVRFGVAVRALPTLGPSGRLAWAPQPVVHLGAGWLGGLE